MNAQWYDDKVGELKLACLACCEVFQSHTGDNIKAWILEEIESFGIEPEQLLAIAIDSAKNVTKAIDDMIDELGKKTYDLMASLLSADLEESVEDEAEIDQSSTGADDIEANENDSVSDDDDDATWSESESDEVEALENEEENNEADFDIFPSSCIRVHCVAHRLQLGINDFLFKKEKNITALIKTASRAMASLHRSTVLRRLALNEVSSLKKPIMNQVTRWSSTFFMLDRLISYEEFCKKCAKDKAFKSLKIPQLNWRIYHALVQMLKPTQVMTSRLQAQDLNVPDAIQFWMEMKTSLSEIKAVSEFPRMVSKLIKHIENREVKVLGNMIAQAGCYLGRQMQFHLSPDATSKAKEVVRMVAMKRWDISHPVIEVPVSSPVVVAVGSNANSSSPSQASQHSDESVSLPTLTPIQLAIEKAKELKKKLLLEPKANPVSTPQERRTEHLEELNKEMEIYEDEMMNETEPQEMPEALKYWKSSKSKFPILAAAALDIISCPMTEVSVERLFSHLNLILSPRRTCLKGDILQDVLFLRVNKRFEGLSVDKLF